MDFDIQELMARFSGWFVLYGFKIIFILFAVFIVRAFGGSFIESGVKKVTSARRVNKTEAEKKREETLVRIFKAILGVVIWVVALLMILQELGVAIAPLLAAAGVAGLAFGFGGQYLIRDLISGLFIVLENQYRVGDVVCVGSTCGLVEDMTLRMTTLRDLNGTVHHIPHGEVNQVSNMTKKFARVNLDVGVSYASNLEKVINVVNKVGNELAEDPIWKESIIKAPQFLRVDDFAESAIIIKILGETKPIKQWDVTGELRKRLKIAFDKEGIVIPFPQRVVHQG
jgi:moderate conductance mechanosensitive channel